MHSKNSSLDIEHYWPDLVTLVNQGLRSSRHISLATIKPDGMPHITPIGSLILQDGCRGYYWEEFPRNLPQNLEQNDSICVMAVNSQKGYWMGGLIRGGFRTWPGVRLYGTAGPRRKGTEEELGRWKKRVRFFRAFKGYKLLWEHGQWIREVHFNRFEPVLAGKMTRKCK